MLEGITPVHLIIVLVVAVLVLGPGKLPETGAALGKAVRDFRHGMSEPVEAIASATSVVAPAIAATATATVPETPTSDGAAS